MIIDVQKFLILGVKEEIDLLFRKAQEAGVAEFISSSHRVATESSAEAGPLLEAIKILHRLPSKVPYEGGEGLSYAGEVAFRVIDLKKEIDHLCEEKRFLETEIVRIAPFGDFLVEDLDYIEREGKRVIQFFCKKASLAPQLDMPEGMFFVGTDEEVDYFLSVNKERISYKDRSEMRIDRPLGELKTHLLFVKDSLHQLEAELRGYAGHLDFLKEALLERLDEHNLESAKRAPLFPLDNALFVVEAWVPRSKIALFQSIAEGLTVHMEPISVSDKEMVPTYFENKGTSRMGEDLVHIYDTPSTEDKDPSGWVFWFFVLFFAMIVNDGGYGLLYLGLCLYIKHKFPLLKTGAKRVLRLATYLSVGCVIWGILTTSFFGLSFAPDGWLRKCSLISPLVEKKAAYHLAAKDDVYQFWIAKYPAAASAVSGRDFLDKAATHKGSHTEYEAEKSFSDSLFMEFSLLVGMIHLSLSLLRFLKRHIAGAGWVLFIWGTYLYCPSVLKATSMVNFLGLVSKVEAPHLGLRTLYIGILVALLLAFVQKRKLSAFGEVSTAIHIFADGLSYLRLYALGLSTAIMAETFNNLSGAVGLFLGVFVLLAGHGITIMMGLMTAMIHGLRLNFIEWYHYSFIGGGRLLRPLTYFKSKEGE